MAKKRRPGPAKRMLNLVFRSNREIASKADIREVYFGLRIRFLGLLTLVMAVIIAILTLIMYLNQQRLIEEANAARARSLTAILGGPAGFYLDKDVTTSPDELKVKYQTIDRESRNFMSYNDDIVKILLTNERGWVRYSTMASDYRMRRLSPYIRGSIALKDEELHHFDFTLDKKNPKTKKTAPNRYRAITFPIVLHRGDLVSLLKDFNRFYDEYHRAGRARKGQIARYLYGRYRETLGDDFDPAKTAKTAKKTKEPPAGSVERATDVDFMFLRLFGRAMAARSRPIPRGERWKWNEAWLVAQKRQMEMAKGDDNLSRAKEIDELITNRIKELAERVDAARRLGVLAVVFDIDAVNRTSAARIRQAVQVALAMMALSIVLFFIVLNFMIKNLKKLERWAISVSGGNLDDKIHITSNDEIGRLGDISNRMIDEIKVKFHLEKFVSKSTKSMIQGAKTTGEPDLGMTGRRNLAFIFSDVRGFTSFSERHDPSTVVEVLNLYLELQSNIVKGNRGDIDDYVGDQIMAHFSGEKRADRAIDTAVKIMREIARMNAQREKEGLPVFQMGIGVHGGEVVTGNIGSSFRMDFACVGDAVNLTSRLCSSAKPGEILASKELFDQATKRFPHEKSPPIEVKGKEKKIPIVRIIY
ncbi:MAG: adenylate/guanylate cyclase domain-containing protein [Spirochaetes bacterium]|nr:adenylate/guanylate cyclase domain-containing protein [Spirochaetota bacterium]